MLGGPVVLCILDGIGWGRRDDGDAVAMADTPNLDVLCKTAPWTLLAAHGTAVGMPSDEDMGNSEVGHSAMGAGRIFDQGAKLVRNALTSGAIWSSEAWARAVQGKTLHLIGLMSDGNVHSHIDHLTAMIERAAAEGVKRLRVHILTDGRDVSPRSAMTWLEPLEQLLTESTGDFAIGSGGGRMHITMDRYEADWPMVERGWKAHVLGEGRRFETATGAIQTLYAEDPGTNDQHLPAFIVGDYKGMEDGDAAVLFNFRGDRAIELCQAFDSADFPHFDRGRNPAIFFAGMMQYDGDLQVPHNFLVAPAAIDNTVGEQLERAGVRSLAISETQKFGHVTYFFNGNRSDRRQTETWEEIPSLQVPFDQAPTMCAPSITERAVLAIQAGEFDHIRLNLANGDMVGHTGVFDATVQAVSCVDDAVGQLMKAVESANGVLLVTADHGNADQMFGLNKSTGEYTHQPHTSHSLNPVPFWLYAPGQTMSLTAPSGPKVSGCIAQVGGTLLSLFGIPLPHDYLPSLIES